MCSDVTKFAIGSERQRKVSPVYRGIVISLVATGIFIDGDAGPWQTVDRCCSSAKSPEVSMKNICRRIALGVIVMALSAAADTAPALRRILIQFGNGTQIFAVTAAGLVGQVVKNNGLKQGQWWSIQKGTLVPGTFDLSARPFGYIKPAKQKIKYAVFDGGATTTIVGIKAGCIFGFYTRSNGDGILGFRSCPSADLAYDYGYNATFVTGMANDGLLVGFHDNPHLQYSGFIVSPSGTKRDYVVPGSDGTQIWGLAPGGRIVGKFLKDERWHGFVADLDGSHLVIVNAEIRGKVAHDTTVVAVRGECTLGYFDMNQNGQSGFVRCKGKKDIAFTFHPTFFMNPRGLLEDGTVFGDFDGNGPTEGFLLPKFVKQE